MREIIENAITNIDDKYIDEAILNICNPQSRNINKVILKAVAVLAAIITLLLVSFTVAVAEGNNTAYKILYTINPTIAEKLTEVNESCEDNGIKMTVEAVSIEGGTADIYISIKDMIGNRIDETIDLFDSYRINTTADKRCGFSFVSYDEDSKTATFLINIEQDKPIKGGKITFSVSELLTGKTTTNCKLDIYDNLDITKGYIKSDTLPVRGGSGDKFDFNKSFPILNANIENSYSPTPGVHIVGYGFIDNKLHIQAYYEDILNYDNHGYIYLMKDQKTVHQDYDISFWDEEKKGSYDEYVFEITPNELEDYDVYGYFVTCNNNIKGNWDVSFMLREK